MWALVTSQNPGIRRTNPEAIITEQLPGEQSELSQAQPQRATLIPFLVNILISDWRKGREGMATKTMCGRMRVQHAHEELKVVKSA